MTRYPQRYWIVVPLLAAGLIAGAVIAGDPVEVPETPLPVRLELELTDGARLIGTAEPVLPVHTAYARLEIPFDLLVKVDFDIQAERLTLDFRNGDRLSGVPALESLDLQTLVGTLAIGIEHIRRINVRTETDLPPALARRLALHYRFDHDEVGRVTDHSGQGNHGTVYGARFVRDGRSDGGAMFFDGQSAYIDSGNAPILQLQSNFTIAAWVWAEPSSQTVGILTKSHGYPNQSRRGIEFMFGNNDRLSAYFWDESTRYMSGGVRDRLLPRRQWTHVVLIHDASLQRQMRFYIDGNEYPVHYGYETVSTVPVVRVVPEPLRIGCMRPGVHHFHGLIAEVMVFDRTLTPEEIALVAKFRQQIR